MPMVLMMGQRNSNTKSKSKPAKVGFLFICSAPEMHTSPKPMLVQSVNSGDNIGQNLSDRGLAHLVTGGLGKNRWGA